jgi:hypothetical protein
MSILNTLQRLADIVKRNILSFLDGEDAFHYVEILQYQIKVKGHIFSLDLVNTQITQRKLLCLYGLDSLQVYDTPNTDWMTFLPCLRYLQIHVNRQINLHALMQLTQLQSLNISSDFIGNYFFRDIVSSLKSLTYLRVVQIGIDKLNLFSPLYLPSLLHLQLGGYNITKNFLSVTTNLVSCDILYCMYSDSVMNDIGNMTSLKSLEVGLRSNFVFPPNLTYLNATGNLRITSLPPLLTLKLMKIQFILKKDDTLSPLTSITNLIISSGTPPDLNLFPNLTSLSLSSYYIPPSQEKAIINMTRLTALKLYCTPNNTNIMLLRSLTTLTSLDVSNSSYNNLPFICKYLTNLTYLNLRHNILLSVEEICLLSCLTKLEVLDLTQTGFRCEEVRSKLRIPYIYF